MPELMNLKTVVFEDNGCWDHIDSSFFIIYEIDPETGVATNVDRLIYPME